MLLNDNEHMQKKNNANQRRPVQRNGKESVHVQQIEKEDLDRQYNDKSMCGCGMWNNVISVHHNANAYV